MASMQVVSGSPAAAGATSGPSGAIDPMMAGFSAEAVAAAAGQAGSETPENPFANEFAAALAALEAQQAVAMAQALADQALMDGQMVPDGELLLSSGQNLPLDPAFQQAVLATFAAVNGAVQGDITAIDAAALAAAQAATDPTAQLVVAAQQGADGLVAEAAAAEVLVNQAPGQEGQGLGKDTQGQTVVNPAAVVATSVASGAQTDLGRVQSADAPTGEGVDAPTGEGVDAVASTTLASAGPTHASQTSTHANNVATASVAHDGAVKVGAQAQSGSANTSTDDGAQQQSANAALAAAAAPKAQVDAAEYAGKETSLAGNLASDAGNVVVTAKANAEGVAAAADAARQSAQRIDATSGSGSAQTAESVAARAESKLEAARASLGSGPLNVEVLKLTKQGGGRAVLEVTPPNQGPIRLDLQLDGAGRASLVVEGLTEAMKARLESSAHFLRQDMAQMGLALNLEMRERNDSNASAQAFNQGQFGQSGSNGRDGSASAKSTTVGAASGNTTVGGGSMTADDGIHLVA